MIRKSENFSAVRIAVLIHVSGTLLSVFLSKKYLRYNCNPLALNLPAQFILLDAGVNKASSRVTTMSLP